MALIEKIYARAHRQPDKVAIVHNNSPVSYRVFASAIEASRRYLAAQGLSPAGVAVLPIRDLVDVWRIGLALRGLGVTTLAVAGRAEIGGLGLPNIQCVVTTEAEQSAELQAQCATQRHRLIIIPTSVYDNIERASPPALPNLPEALGGHILLTSGTTGEYKKVLMSPLAEASAIAWGQRLHNISEHWIANLFGFGNWSGAGYKIATRIWDAGGTVVLYQRPNIHESLAYPGINYISAVPKVLESLIAALPEGLRRDDAIRVGCSSAGMSLSLVSEVQRRLTSQLYDSYSSTEADIVALTLVEQPEDLRWRRVVPGRTLQIVDEDGRPVPVGQVGLVRVDVPTGIDGYLHDPEATRMFFRDGFFYPGDLGELRADGRFALHGRSNNVINVNGRKVAAAPIEEALQDKFSVGGVCLFSRPRADGEEIIHVVLETSRSIPLNEVAAALAGVMPYKFVLRAHFVDALPRTHLGKVQRDVLRQRLGLP
jgi:acyl-coenzyme A synthetase/AMP-(fatty) acid ligase